MKSLTMYYSIRIHIMFLTVFYFSSFISLVLSTQGDGFITIASEVKIFETPKDFQSPLGKVTGVRSCGGPAKLIDWRYEGCTADGICKIPSDGTKLLCHFTFVPSEPIPGGIYIQFNVTARDVPSRFYDVPVPNSAVKEGQSYTLETAGSPTKELRGKNLTFQYAVIRKDGNSVEACAYTDFENT